MNRGGPRLQQIRSTACQQEGRIDYLLFRNKLDHEIRQLDLNRKRSEEIAELVPFAPAIIEMKEARQRVDPLDPSAAAADVGADLQADRGPVEAH
jgi:hypothetical protein